MKCHENPSGGSLSAAGGWMDRQTDMTKFTAAIRFASEPKKNAGLLHKITCKHDKTQNYRTSSVFL